MSHILVNGGLPFCLHWVPDWLIAEVADITIEADELAYAGNSVALASLVRWRPNRRSSPLSKKLAPIDRARACRELMPASGDERIGLDGLQVALCTGYWQEVRQHGA